MSGGVRVPCWEKDARPCAQTSVYPDWLAVSDMNVHSTTKYVWAFIQESTCLWNNSLGQAPNSTN